MTTYRIEGDTLVEVPAFIEAIKSHPDCVTQGREYTVADLEDDCIVIVPDDWGHCSGVHRSYFEPLKSFAISPELKEWLGDRETVTSDEIQLLDECSNCMFPVQPPCRSDCQHIITKAHPAKPKQSEGDEVMAKEWILCAAIHFDDGKKREGQPKNIDSGFVISGRRHHNCYSTLQAIGEALGITEGIVKNMFERVGRDHQGFITNLDRYVSRKEGYKIAKAAKQIQFGGEATDVMVNFHTPVNQSEPILISENLY